MRIVLDLHFFYFYFLLERELVEKKEEGGREKVLLNAVYHLCSYILFDQTHL